jgi:hypothetical protein
MCINTYLMPFILVNCFEPSDLDWHFKIISDIAKLVAKLVAKPITK